MKFSEIKAELIAADRQAIADFEERANNFMLPPISLEDRLSFVDFRRSQLAHAIVLILDELAEREEADAPQLCSPPLETGKDIPFPEGCRLCNVATGCDGSC